MSPLYTQPALFFSGAFLFLWFALQLPPAAAQPRSAPPLFHLAVPDSLAAFLFLLLFLAGALGLMALAGKWFLHNWQA